MTVEQFISQNIWLVGLSVITLPIKGFAIWYSARLSHKLWFIILFISNTLGILDLIYILFVARKYKIETKEETSSPSQ